MRNTVFESCVQAVHDLGILLLRTVGLYPAAAATPTGPVYETRTYTTVTPTFVLGLVHRFFDHFVSVNGLFMPTIHTTNKDNNKFKLEITHRELCI